MNSICFFNKKQFIEKYAKHLLIVSMILLLTLIVGFSTYISYMLNKIPTNITIPSNQETVVDFGIWADGYMWQDNKDCAVSSQGIINNSNIFNYDKINLSKPVTFVSDNVGTYNMQLKLFGIWDIAEMNIDVVDEKYIYAGGFQIGFYMKADGVLVVDCQNIVDGNGNTCSPCKDILKKGDSIIAVNGNSITTKNEFNQYVKNSNCNPLDITIIRDTEVMHVSVTPVKCNNGTVMLGLWIKDDAQGIGTVSFIDDGRFGALGHGVNDVNTEKFLEISYGDIYYTKIMSVVKGKNGQPGEYIGSIDYSMENKIGTLSENVSTGIYGTIDPYIIEKYNLSLMPVGYSSQIEPGEAYIRLYDEERSCDYKINISKLDYIGDRNISFEVTDKGLLEKTNGIVQGMSGAPIIQDGKIVGAVTHVLVNEPTKGYGIFIENMLEH